MTDRPQTRRRVAYITSRFPKLSETFVLYEILAIEELGIDVDVFALVRESEPVHHREADRLAAQAFSVRPASLAVLSAQWYWLRHRPRAYLTAWWDAIRGNVRSPRFLVRALAVVPLAATFARRMSASEVEHIHAHWATHPTLAAYVASRLTGIPYSFTGHAHDIYVDRTMLREKIARAAFVVTISEFNRRLLERLYGPSRGIASSSSTAGPIRTCSNRRAIDPTRPGRSSASPACSRRRASATSSRRAAASSRTASTCAACWSATARRGATWSSAFVPRGSEDRVVLLGQQPRHRVVEILGDADAVAQPSVVLPSGKMEGIPVALMEAMAMERPVVATDISGVAELVEDGATGILVPPGDPAALASALRTLHDDPAMAARLGRAGRQRVVEDFDLTRSANELAGRFARTGPRPEASRPGRTG